MSRVSDISSHTKCLIFFYISAFSQSNLCLLDNLKECCVAVLACSSCKRLVRRYRTHLSVSIPELTAAWLAQLVERRTAVREVEGSSPRPEQHSGSYNN